MRVTLEAVELLAVLKEHGGTLDQAIAIFEAAAEAAVRRRQARRTTCLTSTEVAARCEAAVAAALWLDTPESASARAESALPAPKADSEDDNRPAVTPRELLRQAPIKSAARAGLLASTLPPAAKRVGDRLIHHLNLASGRCDPGTKRLAGDLGLSQRSVRRAIEQLTERGLVRRIVNAGHGHANAYALDLEALAALLPPMAPPPKADSMGSAKADSGAKRTLLAAQADSFGHQNRVRKQSFGAARDHRQRELPLLGVVRRREAAAAGAERRVMDDIEAAARRDPRFNVSSLKPADWAQVHEVEAHQRGAGIVLVRQLVGDTGPPVRAATG